MAPHAPSELRCWAVLLPTRAFLLVWLLDVTPLVHSIQVLEVLIEGTPAVNFVIRDLLHQNALSIGCGWVSPLFSHILPAKTMGLEELVLLDILAVTCCGAEAFGWVSVQQLSYEIHVWVRYHSEVKLFSDFCYLQR